MTELPRDGYWRLRPRSPAPGTVLGPLDGIAVGQAKEYVFGLGPSAFRMIVVRTAQDAVVGYLNICPHYSQTLNRKADAFLSPDGTSLMCSQHFALFRIADGVCFSGACPGEALDPVPVELHDGQIRISPDI